VSIYVMFALHFFYIMSVEFRAVEKKCLIPILPTGGLYCLKRIIKNNLEMKKERLL